jgi:hypothetical protein
VTLPRWTGTYTLTPQGSILRRRIIRRLPVPTYQFVNSMADPLTLWLSADEFRRPFRRFDGFDFGSVPLALQGIVSPLAADKAFALHDSCYEFHAWWTPRGREPCTRRQADDMLRLGMRAQGCGWWTAAKAWLAVRIGGGGAWNDGFRAATNLCRAIVAEEFPEGT